MVRFEVTKNDFPKTYSHFSYNSKNIKLTFSPFSEHKDTTFQKQPPPIKGQTPIEPPSYPIKTQPPKQT